MNNKEHYQQMTTTLKEYAALFKIIGRNKILQDILFLLGVVMEK